MPTAHETTERETRPDPEEPDPVVGPSKPRLFNILGPGLITGASDDDPSGIATYSQAGAQFGYNLSWTLLLTFPLMAAIQAISARVGRTTGSGLARVLRHHYSNSALLSIVVLLFVANTINIGADIGAMADSARLVAGGPNVLWLVLFAVVSATLQVFMQYTRYVAILKWLSVALLAYVASMFMVHVDWKDAGWRLIVPHIEWSTDYLTTIVAVFGTTISPYLFFWQASQEAEDIRSFPGRKILKRAPEQSEVALERIGIDTIVGMGFSNFVALAIVITTAAGLHATGTTHIDTSAQAAQALKPVAGAFASLIFAIGVIGTGLLAVPVLAGSAAYALGEARHWPSGLDRKPMEAKAFYATIVLATLIGVLLNFMPIDPIQALFWSAVINGVVAVPVMVMTMHMASSEKVMGEFKVRGWLWALGWAATGVMALAAIAMFATMWMG